MQQLLTIVLFIFLAPVVHAQPPGITVKAYRQTVAPALRPQGAVIDGEEAASTNLKRPQSAENSWIYFMHPAKNKITVTALYLNGRAYKVKAEAIKHTPVVVTNEEIPTEPKSFTLVPKTTSKVLFLQPAGALANPSRQLVQYGEQNEVVVQYSFEGKTRFYRVKKAKTIDLGNRQ